MLNLCRRFSVEEAKETARKALNENPKKERREIGMDLLDEIKAEAGRADVDKDIMEYNLQSMWIAVKNVAEEMGRS